MALAKDVGSGQSSMTPQLALVVSMAYISAADGDIGESEIGDILRIIPDARTLTTALKIVQGTGDYAQFLEQAAGLLSPAQRRCVLLNAMGTAWMDGILSPEEEGMLNQMALRFEIPPTEHQTYMQVFRIKAQVSVLR